MKTTNYFQTLTIAAALVAASNNAVSVTAAEIGLVQSDRYILVFSSNLLDSTQATQLLLKLEFNKNAPGHEETAMRDLLRDRGIEPARAKMLSVERIQPLANTTTTSAVNIFLLEDVRQEAAARRKLADWERPRAARKGEGYTANEAAARTDTRTSPGARIFDDGTPEASAEHRTIIAGRVEQGFAKKGQPGWRVFAANAEVDGRPKRCLVMSHSGLTLEFIARDRANTSAKLDAAFRSVGFECILYVTAPEYGGGVAYLLDGSLMPGQGFIK